MVKDKETTIMDKVKVQETIMEVDKEATLMVMVKALEVTIMEVDKEATLMVMVNVPQYITSKNITY